MRRTISGMVLILFSMCLLSLVFQIRSPDASGTNGICESNLQILGITPSRNVIGSGYAINVTVIVENSGMNPEISNVTLFLNENSIGTQRVSLEAKTTKLLGFKWNTSRIPLGTYGLTAALNGVLVKTASANVTVTIPGDVNGDGLVNILDASEVASCLKSPTKNIVATTQTILPVAHGYGQKMFYLEGFYWLFYSDGITMQFKTSKNGNFWSPPTIVRNASDGTRFYLNQETREGTHYVHYIYNSEKVGDPIIYCRGKIEEHEIEWQDEQIIIGNPQKRYYPCGVCTDSDGYPFVFYAERLGIRASSESIPFVAKSSRNDGIWERDENSDSFYQLTTETGHLWSGQLVPMIEGVYTIYSPDEGPENNPSQIRGRLWRDGVWGAEEIVSIEKIESNYHFSVTKDQNDNLHLAYLMNEPEGIIYRKRDKTNGWQAEEIVEMECIDKEATHYSTTAPRISITNYNEPLISWIYNKTILSREKSCTQNWTERRQSLFSGYCNIQESFLWTDNLIVYSDVYAVWVDGNATTQPWQISCAFLRGGSSGLTNPNPDINGDGIISIKDATIIGLNWLKHV